MLLFVAVVAGLCAIGSISLLRDVRRLRAVNPPGVTTQRLSPPSKPSGLRSVSDWSCTLRDIVAMPPLVWEGRIVPAYVLELRGGLQFQIDPFDPLAYAPDSDVQRYEALLRAIDAALFPRENASRRTAGEEIALPEGLLRAGS